MDHMKFFYQFTKLGIIFQFMNKMALYILLFISLPFCKLQYTEPIQILLLSLYLLMNIVRVTEHLFSLLLKIDFFYT